MKTPGLPDKHLRALGAGIRYMIAWKRLYSGDIAEERRRVRVIRAGLRALTTPTLIPYATIDRLQYVADRYGLDAADLLGCGATVAVDHPMIQGREALLYLLNLLRVRRDHQLFMMGKSP